MTINPPETLNLAAESGAESGAESAQKSGAQKSGGRALANLLLLEQDFRQAHDEQALARLVVDRLRDFTDYDYALFWICTANGKVQKVIMSDGAEITDDKLTRQWRMKTAKWLAKMKDKNKPGKNKEQMLIDPDMMPPKLFALWSQAIPMSGLNVTMRNPQGKKSGGILLLRRRDWHEATRIMIAQVIEAAGYNLRALNLGVRGKKTSLTQWIADGLTAFLVFMVVFFAVMLLRDIL